MRAYSWNEWNREHIARHGVREDEARFVIEHARQPYPEHVRDGKWLVRGKTGSGRWLQVIYVHPDDQDVDPDSLSAEDLLAYSDGKATVVYVVHSRELTHAERRAARKRS